MRVAIVLFAASLATPAMAQEFLPDGAYVRAFGGAARAVDGQPIGDGPLAGVALGIDRGQTRAEVEVARRSGDAEGRDRTLDTAMVNVYREFGAGRVVPYAGAGIGATNASVSDRDGAASETLATGQVMVGVEYNFGGAASVNGELRYMRTATPDFDDGAIEAIDAVVGITLRF